MNKQAGLGLGLSVGLPTAIAAYFLSGLADKKDKHSLARAIGSILLGATAGYGAHKFFSGMPKGKVSVLKDTNPEVGAEILQSLARSAKLESARRGGNGKDKFPTSVDDIKENMPPVVLSSLVPGTRYDAISKPYTAESTGGYTAKMIPSADAKTVAFEIHPAPGYKGPSQRVKIDAKGPRFMSLIPKDLR